MSIQDRDWYREEWRKKNHHTASKPIGHSRSGDYNLPPLRPSLFGVFATSRFWYSLLRSVVFCLAVYGALALFRDLNARTFVDTPTFKHLLSSKPTSI